MNVGQVESRSIHTLCSLLGYSRQAYYQYQRHQEQEALQADLLLQQVALIRKQQKRLGTRKLLVKMQEFMGQHHFNIGRDALFAG
jgi:hypothetical protein